MEDDGPIELYGIRLVGISAESGRKLLLSIGLVLLVWLSRRIVVGAVGFVLRGDRWQRLTFWIRQALSLLAAFVLVIGLVSLWFDDPSRLTTALGLFSAGLAFALQKVITAIAGYFVIVRGKTFTVGDRIVMGGVRGDVVRLDFTQTTIMEMGQPPPVQRDEPAMWVQSRQYTGRLVTVSNARVFDEPVYNYTRELSFIWEEIAVPIRYRADREQVEQLLLEIADRHTEASKHLSAEDREELARRYVIGSTDATPHVYYRLTDNWLELSVRFLAPAHGVRELKDAISREILRGLDELGVEIASATFELASLPSIRVRLEHDSADTPAKDVGARRLA